MLSLALAALLSVAAGHPVAHNCFIDSALLYSGKVLPVPLVFLTNAQQVPLQNVQIVSQAAPHVSTGPVIAAYSTASMPGGAPAGAPMTVQPTAAVAQATAEFMAAWNAAYKRATKIQTTLVKTAPSGYSHFTPPKQVEETEAVRRATAEFMAAWNAAAERATAVEVGVTYGPPKPVKPTPEVQRATAEFMAAWHAAAQKAAAVNAALTYTTGAPKPVDHTDEVKRATAEFMKAWHAAAARVPKIQTTMYQVSGIHAAPVQTVPQPVKFTPEVERATAEFMAAFNKAAALAAAAPDDTSSLPVVTYSAPVPSETYTGPMASGIIMASGYTKEVDAARREFQLAFEAAAARAAAAPDDDEDYNAVEYVEYSAPAPAPVPAPFPVDVTQQVYSGPFASGIIVESGYTQEVDEARKEFQDAFEEAAALAAAAPDTDDYEGAAVIDPGYDIPALSVTPVVVPATPAVISVPSAMVYSGPKASGIIADSGYTMEVDEARKDFQEAYDSAAALAAAAPDTDDYSGAVVSVQYATQVSSPAAPAAPVVVPATVYTGPMASGHIVESGYTKEVDQARKDFHDAYDSAAALAAAAPDTDDYSGAVISVQYAAPSIVVSPAAPAAPVVVSAPVYTGPMASGVIVDSGYTKEVHEAREEFQEAYEDAAALAAAAPDTDDYSGAVVSVQYSAPAPSLPAPAGPVVITSPVYTGPKASGIIVKSGYTQEVDEARKDFQEAYESAAALAEAAPDVHIYTAAPAAVTHHTGAVVVAPAPAAPTLDIAPAEPARPYTGPLASGVITASGFTKEVEAARQEFLAAYREAAARAPKPDTTQYDAPAPAALAPAEPAAPAPATPVQPKYTGPLASGVIADSGYTIEVDQARKEFMKAYEAAAALAAKTPDYSVVTYSTSTQEGAPKPVRPTADVARATAEFMAAWNAAAARVATIESTLVKAAPATQATIALPTREEALEALRKANEEFMAAWNAAAKRTESVKQAIQYGPPMPVQPTEEVQKATAEFMAAWQAAARRVPKMEQAMTKATVYTTGVPEQVEAEHEVQKATAEFMAAWNAAAARVPKIETTMYAMAQPAAVSAGGPSQFVSLFKTAEEKAVQPATAVGFIPFPVNVGFANNIGTSIAYAGTTAAVPETVATLKTFPLNQRLFAPVQGLPVFYKCECD